MWDRSVCSRNRNEATATAAVAEDDDDDDELSERAPIPSASTVTYDDWSTVTSTVTSRKMASR